MTDHAPSHALSSRIIAERMSGELHRLSARVRQVERALGDMLDREAISLPSSTIHELQKMDLVHQSLCALAEFIDDAAPEMCAEDAIDTRLPLERVPLRDMADRLSGRVQLTTADTVPQTGAFSLF